MGIGFKKIGKETTEPNFKHPKEVVKEKSKPQIRVAKNVYWKQIFKRIGKAIAYSVIIGFVIYLCFAATIIRVLPATNELGFIPIKNITFPGGIAPVGSQLVVSLDTPQGDDSLSRLEQSVIPTNTAALVRVLAGPTGQLTWTESGLITVDGIPMPVTIENKPEKMILANQYLVECLKGCEPGTGLIIHKTHVYGEPLRALTESE